MHECELGQEHCDTHQKGVPPPSYQDSIYKVYDHSPKRLTVLKKRKKGEKDEGRAIQLTIPLLS